MKKIRPILIITLCATLFVDCKKSSEGPAGKDGSANVISKTYDVPTWNSTSDMWFSQLSLPELTSDNINTASVQVYIGTTPNNWLAIPAVVVATTNYFWNVLTTTGKVEVRWEYNGIGIGDNPNEYYGATVKVKVVMIPPSEVAKHQGINMRNYEEVKKAYGLSD